MTGRRAVIAVGNPDRGDDAVGRVVAERLRSRLPDDVEILQCDSDVTVLLERLEEADAVFLIDAAATVEMQPGTIHRFDALDGPLPVALFPLSTHGFSLSDAVELARAMNCLPPACVIYAVEGATFETGRSLSPAVAVAAREVTEQILAELTG
jgi:hydrogenase maturation protease